MGRYQPALLAGLFIGVLSSIPLINVLNMCCCLWVVAGGVLATYLLQQNTPTPIATSDAAMQGLLAGVIGGLICVAVQAVMTSFVGPAVLEQVRTQFESSSEIPPEMRETILRFLTGKNMVLMTLFITVPVYAAFATAGALLGTAFFRKKLPPQPQA
jgi:hypothetical protein